MFNTLVTIAAAYIIVLAALYLFQRQLVFLPSRERPDLAVANLADVMRPVTVRTADGLDLLAWYRPAPGSAATLVYFQGNGGHIGHRAERVRPYLSAGMGVLLVGYRGYGGNPGSPSETGLYQDARAAIEYLAQQGTPPARLVFYGESLGSGVAVQMASELDCAALVLEAPFSSAADVAQSRYWMFPARYLMRDTFESIGKIAAAKCPLFLMHGAHDTVVPVRFGRRLFEAAVEPKEIKIFPDIGHVGFGEVRAHEAVLDFLRRRS